MPIKITYKVFQDANARARNQRFRMQSKNLNGRGQRERKSGACIKDTWTKPKAGRIIEGGGGGWRGLGGLVGGKWRQLYLDNNKKHLKKSEFG